MLEQHIFTLQIINLPTHVRQFEWHPSHCIGSLTKYMPDLHPITQLLSTRLLRKQLENTDINVTISTILTKQNQVWANMRSYSVPQPRQKALLQTSKALPPNQLHSQGPSPIQISSIGAAVPEVGEQIMETSKSQGNICFRILRAASTPNSWHLDFFQDPRDF